MASRFSEIAQAPPVEVFAVAKAFMDDPHPNKVNLSVGAYRTCDCKPWVLPVVKKVELEIANDNNLNHEYLPILGLEAFSNAAARILLGADHPVILEGRATAVQTLSGTGALRIAAQVLCNVLKCKVVYYSDPSWENHRMIFSHAGFQSVHQYAYWDPSTKGLNLDAMLGDLGKAPENAVVILHSCAHNPTGVDPTKEQWKQIADLMEERKLFPLFDSAYQGFASGDLEEDAWAVRYFAKRGFELLAAQSFAKNFGLYNERIGNLTFVVKDASVIMPLRSQVTLEVRGNYSNPPAHGARIVSRVLDDAALFAEWKGCIKVMSDRIKEMRAGLHQRLVKLGTPGNWDHITSQIGMFSYTGLSEEQVKIMTSKHHIYLLSSGRVNMCGLTPQNIDYVAEGIHDAIISSKL